MVVIKLDIETGEYVRTYNGYIAKVTGNRNELILDREIAYHGKYKSYLDEEEKQYVKHSHNIIDLIEIGDILSFENGSIAKIIEIEKPYFLLKNYGGEQYYEKDEWIAETKAILTHEQMESNCYRLED